MVIVLFAGQPIITMIAMEVTHPSFQLSEPRGRVGSGEFEGIGTSY